MKGRREKEAKMEEEEAAALMGEREEVDGEKKVKEVEIHLFRQGQGLIGVFKSQLGGCEKDRLEVREILHNHSFKSIYAFNPRSGRGAPIRFNRTNGRSILPYRDGVVLYIDGEPKDSLLKPVTRILVGMVLITIMIILVSRDAPEWFKKFNVSGVNFLPLILAFVVIVFTRMRKRISS